MSSLNNLNNENFNRISTLIQTERNIYLVGAPGSGKSTFVNSLLDKNKVRFIVVQCFSNIDKKFILYEITYQIQFKYNIKSQNITTIQDFIDYIPFFKSQLKKQQPDFNNQKTFYIVLDDYDRIKESHKKFYSTFLNLQKISNNQVQLIITSNKFSVGDSNFYSFYHFQIYGNQLLQKHSAIDQSLQITIDNMLNYDQLKELEKINILKILLQMFKKEIQSNFKDFNMNLNKLNKITFLLLPLIIEYINANDKQSVEEFKQRNKSALSDLNKNYKYGKKILLENQNYQLTYEEFKDKIINYNPFNRTEQLQYLDQKILQSQLSDSQGLFLIACSIANRNQQFKDKLIFYNNYQYSKKNKSKQQKQKEIKQNFFYFQSDVSRILEIIDHLINKQMENNNYDSYQYERTFHQHSIQFCNQIADLEEKGLILKTPKNQQELQNHKFVCQVDLDQIKVLSYRFKIDMNNYLGEI